MEIPFVKMHGLGNDFILIDFGSQFRGYHSDQTRTVVCGGPSLGQQKIYRIVKEAHDKAIERVRPGIPIGEVDGAARDYIRDEGYGEYFGHGTGHGIGLAVHEDPTVNSENKGLLPKGVSAHTFFRGAGKDVRDALYRLTASRPDVHHMSLKEFIKELSGAMKTLPGKRPLLRVTVEGESIETSLRNRK
jgi:hypothetical protein